MDGTVARATPRPGAAPSAADVAEARGRTEYVLGARISLEDFLALPAGGYDRDEEERLVLMSPDSFEQDYWILNAGVDDPGCPLPPRSALFLAYEPASARWVSLPVDGARPVADVRGHSAYATGRFRSAALRGFELDIDAFFKEAAPAGGAASA